MKAPNNDFWLCLHRLAESYTVKGTRPSDRLHDLRMQFKQMSALAQRELMADLTLLALHIPEVYSAVAVDALAATRNAAKAEHDPVPAAG